MRTTGKTISNIQNRETQITPSDSFPVLGAIKPATAPFKLYCNKIGLIRYLFPCKTHNSEVPQNFYPSSHYFGLFAILSSQNYVHSAKP